MSLLTLKNIGKIYVSDNNVSVGIRGVNLSFDRGEFVAITGTSGSGKSTLLNVISGMDTYEEGELLINGEQTSHYLQRDWEEYRKQYISFIFQDYNIIESFTVLQNVELALMNIESPRERRRKAVELLRRVGLEKHLNHKGSKLSGGQKQRTVIARALAKDSPIILADEPTGNLDSQSSAEIIELLREVSADKLVIVVTHNFEQVEGCATRHIRVFDGSVESDQILVPTVAPANKDPHSELPPMKHSSSAKSGTVRNGLLLGSVRFRATPRLSAFLCILMVLTSLVLTLMTSLSSGALEVFDKTYLFQHMDGRVVVLRRDGAVLTDDELKTLAERIGAESYIHYDYMLDQTASVLLNENRYDFHYAVAEENTALDAGRLPTADNEVALSVPLSLKEFFGGRNSFTERVLPEAIGGAYYTVTGVRYRVDNTADPVMLFSENGYRTATALSFFAEQNSSFTYSADFGYNTELFTREGSFLLSDFSMEPGTFCFSGTGVEKVKAEAEMKAGKALTPTVTLSGVFQNYRYDNYGYTTISSVDYASLESVSGTLAKYRYLPEIPEATAEHLTQIDGSYKVDRLIVAPDVLRDFLYEAYYAKSYTQASLFFRNDREAKEKVDELRSLGYTGIPSDTTVRENILDRIFLILSFAFQLFGWFLSVVFATIFLNLCSSRAMNATRGDIAIMRSMGIPMKVIRVSTYVQTLITLIPAYLITGITCAVLFLIPQTNGIFNYLHAPEYILIALMLFAIAVRLSRKYVKKMFRQSVKKTLKGGSANE